MPFVSGSLSPSTSRDLRPFPVSFPVLFTEKEDPVVPVLCCTSQVLTPSTFPFAFFFPVPNLRSAAPGSVKEDPVLSNPGTVPRGA